MIKTIDLLLPLAVCLALAIQSGCSKKDDTTATEAGTESVQSESLGKPDERPRQPRASEKEARPAAKATVQIFSPVRESLAGLSTPTSEQLAAMEALSSPAAIAQALKSFGDRDAAQAAIKEYARNNPGCLSEMTSLLRSGDPDLAALGAQGLAVLATPEALAELVDAIQGTPPGTARRQLCGALSEFNNPELGELLVSLLASMDDREIVSALQRALGNSANGRLLRRVVQQYHVSHSATERDNLIAAIRQMHNPEVVDELLAILNEQKVVSSTEPLSLAVADTLGIIGTPLAVSNLFQYLWSLREGASSPVYDAIGRVSNPDSLPLIASVAAGQVPGSSLYSRMAAVQALGNYSSNSVYPLLQWLIQNDPNAGIREAAAAALQRAAGR